MISKRVSSGIAAFMALVLAFSCFAFPMPAAAASGSGYGAATVDLQSSDSATLTVGDITISYLEDFGGYSTALYSESPENLYVYARTSRPGASLTVTSSNAAVSVTDCQQWGADLKVRKIGTYEVTVSDGVSKVAIPIVVYNAYGAKVKSVKKAAYNKARVTWTPMAGVSGYKVMRMRTDSSHGSRKVVATVQGANASSAVVAAPWNVEYDYDVVPFVTCNGTTFESQYVNDRKSYGLPSASIKISSVAKKSGKHLALKWTADAGVSSYSVYRSTQDGRGFKKIATTKAKSYIDKKVKKGVTYYYQIRASYPGCGTVSSLTFGQIIPKSSKVARKAVSIGQDIGQGSYGWNWASSDQTFYYSKGSRLYAVTYRNGNLKVCGFNSAMKKVSTKTVKLPKHGVWGGYYHGPDGNNYVAIGWNNPKESKTKTVIQVIKYNSNWKKVKTASIKGAASNAFQGIYRPFDAGAASFDMQGNTLYLFTCREMFETEDGLHHQSNIAFSINTKTMKAKTDNVAYTSHSFNQRVRFKDGSIYLADHGDAYNRSICITSQGYTDESLPGWYSDAFPFKGMTGENFTGATMGGMEVGAKNVLTCGTAQPHNFKVAGVKGFGNYKHNVFVTVTNRATGKSSVKWLTSLNPKKSKQTVSEARMVKLSDDRFAVMYSIASDKTGKGKFYCTVIDGAGKKLKTKSYSNITFTGSVQPVLHNGCIFWSERTGSSASSIMYRIPAL